jgi:hypothetical protein
MYRQTDHHPRLEVPTSVARQFVQSDWQEYYSSLHIGRRASGTRIRRPERRSCPLFDTPSRTLTLLTTSCFRRSLSTSWRSWSTPTWYVSLFLRKLRFQWCLFLDRPTTSFVRAQLCRANEAAPDSRPLVDHSAQLVSGDGNQARAHPHGADGPMDPEVRRRLGGA